MGCVAKNVQIYIHTHENVFYGLHIMLGPNENLFQITERLKVIWRSCGWYITFSYGGICLSQIKLAVLCQFLSSVAFLHLAV